jgi:hypothetical protein
MGQDLESREDVPTPSSPIVEPNFVHHNGNEVLQCPGAVLVFYGKNLASLYPVSVCSNNDH